MTKYEQTARLAETVANAMRYRNLGQLAYLDQEVYGTMLKRRTPFYRGTQTDVREDDPAILHQIEYAIEHVSPADLERQARELRLATSGGITA